MNEKNKFCLPKFTNFGTSELKLCDLQSSKFAAIIFDISPPNWWWKSPGNIWFTLSIVDKFSYKQYWITDKIDLNNLTKQKKNSKLIMNTH